MNTISEEIISFNQSLSSSDQAICDHLAEVITEELTESQNKIWHRHPVWFIEGNPIVGYSRQKDGVRLMFWSGGDFGEPDLILTKGKFRDASIFYKNFDDIELEKLSRWIKKSRDIQWDYKNIVKRKGVLIRLK